MLFKLLKNVWSAGSFGLRLKTTAILSFLWAIAYGALLAQDKPPSNVLAYKGVIDSIRDQGIRSMDLRSDGRYLFFSTGGTAVNALDLQDMGLVGPGIVADENVKGVFMNTDAELIVTHAGGVQYFDVSSPFAIEELDLSYARPTEASGLDVEDSCRMSQRQIALLESSANREHILRLINGSSYAGQASWGAMFPNASNDLEPIAVICSANAAFVIAMEDFWGSAEKVRMAKVSPSGGVLATAELTIDSNYVIEDLILSAKGDQLLLLFNRESAQNRVDDSIVMTVSPESLGELQRISVGSMAKALTTFRSGDDYKVGIFVGKDYLKNSTNPPTDQLLVGPAPLLNSNQIESDRGEGSAQVGTNRPSRWVSSVSDHYKYGLTESLGVSLVGRGPRLSITERPSVSTITQSVPLTFKFSTDRAIQYQIRLDQNYDLEGTAEGLSRSPGNLIASGTLAEDAESDVFSYTSTALSLSLDRKMSLSIIAWDPEYSESSAPQARIGIPFTHDPPPGEVLNLRLKFGDNSIHLSFEPPPGGDITGFLVDFSYEESDLSNFTNADRSFESGLDGYTLTSPLRANESSYNGKVIIAPIQNYRTVYLKIYAVDKSGQITENPTTQTGQGFNTLTVPDALSGAQTCQLNIDAESPWDEKGYSLWILLLLLCLGVVGLRNRRLDF